MNDLSATLTEDLLYRRKKVLENYQESLINLKKAALTVSLIQNELTILTDELIKREVEIEVENEWSEEEPTKT